MKDKGECESFWGGARGETNNDDYRSVLLFHPGIIKFSCTIVVVSLSFPQTTFSLTRKRGPHFLFFFWQKSFLSNLSFYFQSFFFFFSVMKILPRRESSF